MNHEANCQSNSQPKYLKQSLDGYETLFIRTLMPDYRTIRVSETLNILKRKLTLDLRTAACKTDIDLCFNSTEIRYTLLIAPHS